MPLHVHGENIRNRPVLKNEKCIQENTKKENMLLKNNFKLILLIAIAMDQVFICYSSICNEFGMKKKYSIL